MAKMTVPTGTLAPVTSSPTLAAPAIVPVTRQNIVNQVMGKFAETFQTRRDIDAWRAKWCQADRAWQDKWPAYRRELRHEIVAAHLNRAELILAALPPVSTIVSAHDAMVAVATGKTDEPATQALIGLMLDGIPSAKNLESDGYVDAMVFTLVNGSLDGRDDFGSFIGRENFAPAVIAGTIRMVWRQCTFAPSIHEFIELARKAKAVFHRAAGEAERLRRQVEEARALLIENGKLAPDPDDIPWKDPPPGGSPAGSENRKRRSTFAGH